MSIHRVHKRQTIGSLFQNLLIKLVLVRDNYRIKSGFTFIVEVMVVNQNPNYTKNQVQKQAQLKIPRPLKPGVPNQTSAFI